MKFYLYISDAKIDMLFAQIPFGFLEQIAGELKINVGVLSASVKRDPGELDRYKKAEAVSKYIDRNSHVGTLDSPEEYFRGQPIVRWEFYGDTKSVVYFGGKTEQTWFGLGGSSKHMVGGNRESQTDSFGSYTGFMLAALRKEIPEVESHPGLAFFPKGADEQFVNELALTAVIVANLNSQGPSQKVEFLAKRLLFGVGPSEGIEDPTASGRNVLLGTPLYVATAD